MKAAFFTALLAAFVISVSVLWHLGGMLAEYGAMIFLEWVQ